MKIFDEFKEFAVKGNAFDLAVGVIIGTAFGKIVTSLVSDILMPTLGLIIGNIDFTTLALTVGESSIPYGLFLQSVVDFVIIAFCIFMVVKQLNRFKAKPAPATPAEPSAEVKLLTEIRDALKTK